MVVKSKLIASIIGLFIVSQTLSAKPNKKDGDTKAIASSVSQPIHGKDGADGGPGENGQPGEDGKNGGDGGKGGNGGDGVSGIARFFKSLLGKDGERRKYGRSA